MRMAWKELWNRYYNWLSSVYPLFLLKVVIIRLFFD